jgi:hypothetical protein
MMNSIGLPWQIREESWFQRVLDPSYQELVMAGNALKTISLSTLTALSSGHSCPVDSHGSLRRHFP